MQFAPTIGSLAPPTSSITALLRTVQTLTRLIEGAAMRTLSLCIMWVACSASVLGQSSEADVQQIVRQGMATVSGGYTGSMQKAFVRMGDACATELAKVVSGRELNDVDINSMLLLIEFSFERPDVVATAADREPRATLFVLRYLALSTKDPKLRQKITATRDFVKGQYAKVNKHEPRN